MAKEDAELRERGRIFGDQMWTRFAVRSLGQQPTATACEVVEGCYVVRIKEDELEYFGLTGLWDVRKLACTSYMRTVAIVLWPREDLFEQLIWFKLKFENKWRKVVFKIGELDEHHLHLFT